MKPEIKALWIEALESGEYKQGHDVLRREDVTTGEVTYCCLGVLAELACQAGVVTRDRCTYFTEDSCASSVLSGPIMDWAGMDSPAGELSTYIPIPHEGGLYRSLTGLNDLGQYDFHQIAQVIREQF